MVNRDLHVRFSFLVRHPELSPEEFRRHYRDVHGPLAAAQAGFRKYTSRYVQNHVRESLRDGTIQADGITATTQVPRADYNVGFFAEPDYAVVQEDELFLFDVQRTRSVVGRAIAGDGTAATAPVGLLALTSERPDALSDGPAAWVVFQLDHANASALGFGAGDFSARYLLRAGVENAAAARAVVDRHPEWTEAWLVDEIEIFSSTNAGDLPRDRKETNR